MKVSFLGNLVLFGVRRQHLNSSLKFGSLVPDSESLDIPAFLEVELSAMINDTENLEAQYFPIKGVTSFETWTEG